jgi:hypothetical protein
MNIAKHREFIAALWFAFGAIIAIKINKYLFFPKRKFHDDD